MKIERREYTKIPNTKEGRKFADHYEGRLKSNLAYYERFEYDNEIVIYTKIFFNITDIELEEDE